MTSEQPDLPPPLVSPDAYDDDYYRHGCAGADEWRTSGGTEVAGIYPGSLERAGLRPGEVVVDIGTGRGELLATAVGMGAARAIGVEYSPAAVALAEQTLDAQGVRDRAEVLLADARATPVDDGTADLVTMLDVVEHLAPAELAGALTQAHRILRPGGRVFIHTLPTRTLYDVTYRWQRQLRASRRRTWPADPRNDYERQMHVNEQTLRSLRRSIRDAGFTSVDVRPGAWVHTEHIPDQPARRVYHRAAKIPLLQRLVVADLWATGVRP
jgi:ubiquinone/menaquinone biosynthesis C-methylase UbiE